MLTMADGGCGLRPEGDMRGVDGADGGGDVGGGGGGGGGGGEDVSIDLDFLMNILDASPNRTQEDLSYENLKAESTPDASNDQSFQLQNGYQMVEGSHTLQGEPIDHAMFNVSYKPEISDGTTGGSGDSFCSPGNFAMGFDNVKGEPSSQISSPMYTCSGSLEEWCSPSRGNLRTDRAGVSQPGIPSCNASSFPEGDPNFVVDHADYLTQNHLLSENETHFIGMGGETDSKDASCGLWMNNMNGVFGYPDAFVQNYLGISGCENDSHKSTMFCNPDVTTQSGVSYFPLPFCTDEDDSPLADVPDYFHVDCSFKSFPSNGVIRTNEKDEIGKFQPENACNVLDMMTDEAGISAEFLSNTAMSGKYSCSDENILCLDEESRQSSDGISPSIPGQKHAIYMTDKIVDATNNHLSCMQGEGEGKLIQNKGLPSNILRISPESIQSSSSGNKSHLNDDTDICILGDISQPASSNQSMTHGKAIVPSQHSAYGDSLQYIGHGNTRLRTSNERFIFQIAMQDISQPKTEASPPDGVLAVPLLRHQRIALSWMVQKETYGMYCSGGILADDQGLGKTVSTIALILKERPSLKADLTVVKKEELETLNLDDDDDDEVTEVDGSKQGADDCKAMLNPSCTKNVKSFGLSKGRPAAGTLVVCPTSVLRQWAEELRKKVTNEANLSVLVYHGSNRTKDPWELAKYDVVLTTYSIVSMEVPKQPLVDEYEDGKFKTDSDNVPPFGLSSGNKRKYPPNSGKKGSKNKKGMDTALLEAAARPLAKVAWFRVVLDEAQSIKNHRTQVARACWGLRAKRRWCLSGTPIQNAIDDLYSYFRFLRYDPYAVYRNFCSAIKVPIQKNPMKGYKKLQAILKTIMLRRTKGTLIDGEPIINLPPKVIELKKVDFTEEERHFYTRLENDSRQQFKEYTAAGTVKQNYVNILLMLLRLRQACDHPLLVRDLDSRSLGRSSIEMAKKLPQEKQIDLLNCLEASLALCGICNDPPEDAVVSVCGHVFCNQCICEHLTGDDNQCPTSNCKVRLNVSSVFSKATLNGSLCDQPGQDGSDSDRAKAFNANSDVSLYDSSKIKAALEVLQSLTRPHDCTSTSNSLQSSFTKKAICPEILSCSGNSPNVNTDERTSNADKNVSNSIKVVGEKAIVFSQWTGMLDLLEGCLKKSSIQFRRLDGTMSVVARDKAVKDFNTLPEVSVMIMSLKAASLGLNMVAACRVLLLDLWWNPTTEDQAIDRAHRIGQTRPVNVLRLTVKDTVEDRILALQQKKREMVASAFGEDETGARQTRLTVDDLNYLFMV